MKKLLPLALAVGFSACQAAEPPPESRAATPASQASTDSNYCDSVEQFAHANRKGARIFGVVANEVAATPQWKEFADEAAMEKELEGDSALVWAREGRTVFVRFTYSSPSGDWVHNVDYCFGEDGRLRRAQGELRTFYGNVRKVRVIERRPDGSFVETRSEVFDLESNKRITAPAQFMDRDVPLIKAVQELPFARLLNASALGRVKRGVQT